MAVLLNMTMMFSAPTPATAFEPLKALMRPAPRAEQLRLANQAINPLDDEPTPHTWLAPGELAQRGAGACKDLAFAKYRLLKGVAREHHAIRPAHGHVHLQRLNGRADLSVQFSFDESGCFDGLTHQPRTGLRIKGWAELQAWLATRAPTWTGHLISRRSAEADAAHSGSCPHRRGSSPACRPDRDAKPRSMRGLTAQAARFVQDVEP